MAFVHLVNITIHTIRKKGSKEKITFNIAVTNKAGFFRNFLSQNKARIALYPNQVTLQCTGE